MSTYLYYLIGCKTKKISCRLYCLNSNNLAETVAEHSLFGKINKRKRKEPDFLIWSLRLLNLILNISMLAIEK